MFSVESLDELLVFIFTKKNTIKIYNKTINQNNMSISTDLDLL